MRVHEGGSSGVDVDRASRRFAVRPRQEGWTSIVPIDWALCRRIRLRVDMRSLFRGGLRLRAFDTASDSKFRTLFRDCQYLQLCCSFLSQQCVQADSFCFFIV